MRRRKQDFQIYFDFETGREIFPAPPTPSYKTDNERILAMQEEFLKDRKKGSQNFFKSMKDCAIKMVRHQCITKGLPFIDYDEKATDAILYILEQFAKRPDFKLSFPSAYIRLRVLASLFRHKKIDEITKYTGDDL